ncbi:MAG: hypothetical protein AAGE93_18425 [Bacteroidota bacterium]
MIRIQTVFSSSSAPWRLKHYRFVFIVGFLLPNLGQPQTRLILENKEGEKRIVMEEGDKVRVRFQADSILARQYRPWPYRRPNRRISYAQGSILAFTDSSFIIAASRSLLRRLLNKPSDTLSVGLDQVMAIDRTSAFGLVGTTVLSNAVLRGGALVVLTATGNFWIFAGTHAAGFVAAPFTKRYVRSATTPLRKVPRTSAKWSLYLENIELK